MYIHMHILAYWSQTCHWGKIKQETGLCFNLQVVHRWKEETKIKLQHDQLSQDINRISSTVSYRWIQTFWWYIKSWQTCHSTSFDCMLSTYTSTKRKIPPCSSSSCNSNWSLMPAIATFAFIAQIQQMILMRGWHGL